MQFESLPSKADRLFSFFQGLGYRGTMFLGNRYLPYSEGWRVPHPKFGFSGHRGFLFFPESAIGSTVPPELYRGLKPSVDTVDLDRR